jgi:hypothetical protein
MPFCDLFLPTYAYVPNARLSVMLSVSRLNSAGRVVLVLKLTESATLNRLSREPGVGESFGDPSSARPATADLVIHDRMV